MHLFFMFCAFLNTTFRMYGPDSLESLRHIISLRHIDIRYRLRCSRAAKQNQERQFRISYRNTWSSPTQT